MDNDMVIYVISDDYRLHDLGNEYPYHAREPDRKFRFGYEGIERGKTRMNGRDFGVEYRFYREVNVPHPVRGQAQDNNEQLVRHLRKRLFEGQRREEESAEAEAETTTASVSAAKPSKLKPSSSWLGCCAPAKDRPIDLARHHPEEPISCDVPYSAEDLPEVVTVESARQRTDHDLDSAGNAVGNMASEDPMKASAAGYIINNPGRKKGMCGCSFYA